jgi:RNA polymerase sigma factor (sigma-70 family)
MATPAAKPKQSPKIRPFPPEELRRLWRLAWVGDEAALGRLEVGYSYLVKRRAHVFQGKHPGAPLEDLLGCARIGLVKAVRHWTDGKTGNFVSHAVRAIDGELQRGLSDLEGPIHVPANARRKLERITACGRMLLAELGREPTAGEILARLGMDEADFKDAAAAAVGGDIGLAMLELNRRDKARPPSSLPPELRMLCEATETPETEVLSGDMRLWRRALNQAGGRYRFILCERWGWAGRRGRTLREVGEALGLSRGRVHQLEDTAIRKLFRFARTAGLLKMRTGAARY